MRILHDPGPTTPLSSQRDSAKHCLSSGGIDVNFCLPVSSTDDRLSRTQVAGFLSDLSRYLQSILPSRDVITSQVRTLMSGKESQVWKHKPESPESAFIGEYVLPNIEGFLQRQADDGQRGGDPLKIIRVGFPAPEKYSSSGFAFFPGHPFGKVVGKPEVMYRRWKEGGVPLIQSWPDLTLLSPYRTLFECKYFNRVLKSPARIQLVTDLYQTFFYRALPLLPPKNKHAGWDYEYACYLAYDATVDGWLSQAWNGLPEKVRNSFWEQANIFVMILPETQHH